jgi:hypothetical protein
MKNTILILSLVALLAACGQSGQKQSATKPDSEIADTLVIANIDENITVQEENTNAFAKDDETFEVIFVEETDWEGVECNYYDHDSCSGQYCSFPKANLRQVYDIVKKTNRNLKTELPTENLDYSTIEADVKYKYNKWEKSLLILLDNNEQATIIQIYENKDRNETDSWINYILKSDDCEMETDWDGAVCRFYEYDLYMFYEITYPNANLRQVYDLIKKEYTILKSELPAGNIVFPFPNSDNSLEYRYQGKKHLIIDVVELYEDGRDIYYIDIIEKENETKFRVITYGAHL